MGNFQCIGQLLGFCVSIVAVMHLVGLLQALLPLARHIEIANKSSPFNDIESPKALDVQLRGFEN